LLFPALLSAAPQDDAPAWVESAKNIHYRFTGRRGSFAQFGDSITYSTAYWYPIGYSHPKMSPAAQQAYDNVNTFMFRACWGLWKGPKYGNMSGKSMAWAADHIDEWLKELNPETALIQFGTDDMTLPAEQYEQKLREVIQKCMANGTVVMLSTLPPKHDMMDKVKQYSDVIRKISAELKLPLIDLLNEILSRRPDDWDRMSASVRAAIKNNLNFETLLGYDGIHLSYTNKSAGDWSEQGLRNSGYGLRTYLTLLAYDQVINRVLK